MGKEQFEKYDRVVSTTLLNLMIEDTRNGGLALQSFNPKNVEHLYVFEVSMILNASIQKEVYLEMSLFNYWKFKLKNWTIRKTFKRFKNNKDMKLTETNAILNFMKKDLLLEDNVYEEIYKAYYEKGIENRSIYRWKCKR